MRGDDNKDREIDLEAVKAAETAHLRYVNDLGPGIRRQRRGKSFRYLDVNGKRLRDPNQLRRIQSLVIPPAWTDVWICPVASGHLQATGHDTKHRKQYLYHPRWRQVRDGTKFHRMMAFGKILPRIRRRVRHDLRRRGLSREKVLATIVRLLETTHIRIGNQEYAKTNNSFGLTTMRNRHVEVAGSTVRFQFRGKGGKLHEIDIRSPRLARIVRRCQEIPGHELFQYLDENNERHVVDSGDVNEYLREITGEDFTAKDFRTWAGTVRAVRAFRDFPSFHSETHAKKNVAQVMKIVAQNLGNTPAICRKCYVHPAVVETYLDRSLVTMLPHGTKAAVHQRPTGLTSEERDVQALLKRYRTRQSRKKQK